jgi:UDP-N-acetylmuramate--alanine ligase
MGELLHKDIDLVVRTAAVPDSNTEFMAAKKLGLPTIKYAQLLGEIMQERMAIAVCGSHGKSTTTAMISHALLQCGADPSFVVGGTVPQLGGSSRSGQGQSFVVEACEYDRSFHNLHPTVCLITNIEADHLDCYKDLNDIIFSFRHFATLVPSGGLIIANGQDKNVAKAISALDVPIEYVGLSGGTPVNKLTWETVQVEAKNGCPCGSVFYKGQQVATLQLSVPGVHNLYNATAALAACRVAGVDLKKAAEALSSFTGVDRRMTLVGAYKGATIVDDYGHHPTEIAATVKALKEKYKPTRVICVFQPHQHSRTRTLLDEFATCFHGATQTLIADIYAVRDSEEEKRLTTSKTLVDRVTQAGANALHLPTFPQIVEFLKQNARSGDLILTIGAGNVFEIAHELANQDGPANT